MKRWTMLAKVDGGNAVIDRGEIEMLKARIKASRRVFVPVMLPSGKVEVLA